MAIVEEKPARNCTPSFQRLKTKEVSNRESAIGNDDKPDKGKSLIADSRIYLNETKSNVKALQAIS
jgi:hypothetical protein